MLVQLSDVLTSEGKVQDCSVPLEMQSFESRLGKFDIIERTPIRFTFTNIGTDKARVEGGLRITFKAVCDRCLADVPVTLDLKFDRVVVSPGVLTEDQDDQGFMDGYQLDAEAFVYNEILVNWPMKILCREDCKGVCPVCGQNLNERECGCDTFVPDPRMAAIQDIFNANKEV